MTSQKNRTEPILIWFLIIATIAGLAFSFLVVPWQTPDELTHLNLIGLGIKNDELGAILSNDLDLDATRLQHHTEEKVNVSKLLSSLNQTPQYEKQACLPRGVDLSILDHLPATIGLELGILLGLPTYWVLQCAEIFALAFYVLIGCFSLKLVPDSHKKIFFFMMLMPMCLHQAASINYDAVLLPLCFLFVALIWHDKALENDIGWKKIIIYALILFVITMIKLPYVLMGILVFVIPVNQICLKFGKKEYRLKKSFWTYFCIILFLLAMGFAATWVMRNTTYVKVLFACAGNVKQTCHLLLSTLQKFTTHLVVSFAGNFGWLDTPLPKGVVYIYLTLIVVMAATAVRKEHILISEGLRFSISDLGVIFLFLISLGFMITFSMISHTVTVTLYGVETTAENIDFNEALYWIQYIGGLQGRYYIPLAIPFLSIFPAMIETDEKKMRVLTVTISCIMIIISCLTIYQRYFG